LGWGSAGKAFFGSFQVSIKMQFNVTRRCSIVPLRSTGQLLSRVFVVLLRKSIPQSRNLKAAAELNVTLGKKLKATASVKSQKQKLCVSSEGL
jgi:hypothetical protein